MQISQAIPHRSYFDLLRMSQALGVMKWVGDGKYQMFKLAYHPFVSTKSYHHYLAQLHEIWHRVLLRVAQDRQFLIDIFSGIADNDDLLKGVLDIVKKRANIPLKDGICLDRIDYYNDEQGQPKLTEYNLQCVGMMSHMQRFQDAKRLLENSSEYVSSETISNFSHAIRELVDVKKIEGVLLFVVYYELQGDPNYFDQCRFEIQLRKKALRVVRTNLKEMANMLIVKENGDLYFGEEKVAVVYYRSIYRIEHYKFGQGYDVNQSWNAREKVALSNAISIPPIEFELVNEKRVQTELAKPSVLKRYATEEEAKQLTKTRVKEWEFDTITQEELNALIKIVEADPEGFFLKPNMEGGGNNIFGRDILKKLLGDHQALRSYILMQKIETKIIKNIILDGHNHESQDCEYEISRYGTLTWANGEIVRNQADGFLIRAKPPTAHEGGIMAGIGAIVTWKVTE